MKRLFVAVAVLLGVAPAAAAQQQEQPPLEDVVLQGRVLRPDGSPLANTAVRVDARRATSGFAIFSFFATAGFSTVSCFDPNSELCILPNTKTFRSTTDGNGRYRFVFPQAKRQGEQTNTDYFLSVALGAAIAQYELELLTPVHNAPDLVVWDPKTTIEPGTRTYGVAYQRRADSNNNVQLFVGEQQVNLARGGSETTIEARDIEDNTVRVVPYASRDERAEGTIYHQRFTASPVLLRGALVPLSRNAPCGVTLQDGRNVAGCGYTDGDIVTAGRTSDERELAVRDVTIDLGAPKEVAEVRARGCTCTFSGSVDGTTWSDLGAGASFRPRTFRFVRAAGSLSGTAEVSVWGPWPDDAAPTPLAPSAAGEPAPTPLLPPGSDEADSVPRALYVLAIAALAFAAYQVQQRRRTA